MTKEEARLKLNKAQSILNLVEMDYKNSENRIAELKEDIEKFEAIINKKDDWREKLIQPNSSAYFYIGYGVEGVTTYADRNTDRKPEYAFRKPSHAQLLADKIQLMQEMHAFAHVKNEGWVANWGDEYSPKFGIVHNIHKGFTGNYSWGCNDFIFGISVKSIEIAAEMLEEFGERIKKIYNKQY